jgi:hypothetical protein
MWGSNTFAASACGLTSLDMAIASWKGWTTKKDYNLHDFAHKLRDLLNRADECHWSAGGLDPSCIMQAPAKFGLQDPVNLGFDWQKAKGYLKKGVPVISSYSKGYWTSNSHFILLVGIDNNGKILVNDPNPNNCSHGCKTFCHEPVDENKVDGTGGGSLTGGFYAILGPNGQEGTVSCEAGGSGKLAQGNYAELKAELKRLIKKGVFRIQMPACAGADIDNNSIKEDMLRLTVTVGKKLEAEGLHIDISVFMKCHNPGTCHNPLGEAGDFADGGDRENLKKVTRVVMPWLYKNRKDFKIWQLIFDSDQIGLDSNKYNIGDGIHFAYPEATLIEHQNHIHLAAGGCQ